MRADPSRWTLSAILLLVGANLVIDPGDLGRIGEGFATGIRNFERQYRWRQPWRTQRRIYFAPLPRTGMRLAGVILIALGLAIAVVA